MADNKNLSVPEILALCRQQDGDGAAAEAPADPPAEAAAPPAESKAPAEAKPAAKADPGKMSVADMLAAARAEKSGDAASEPTEDSESSAPAAAAAPAAKLDPKKMSVADMLAAARGEKTDGGAAAKAKPAAKGGAKAKPAAKKAPAKAAAPTRSGPMDTSSILAAARSAAKPGPMTKAEAAAKAKAEASGGKPAKPTAPPMPAKPEYARAVEKPKKEKELANRRTMMEICFGSALAIGFGAMTMAAGLSSLVLARFFFPNLLVEPPSRFKVGFPGDFSGGTVTTKYKAQFGVWVVNAEYEGQQQIFALKSVCTHLGCTPNWLEAEQKFKCPCHGSGFYKEGINFEGPAPRPLERYSIRLADDGQLEIDKSKTFQEQLGQWRDGASFVPV